MVVPVENREKVVRSSRCPETQRVIQFAKCLKSSVLSVLAMLYHAPFDGRSRSRLAGAVPHFSVVGRVYTSGAGLGDSLPWRKVYTSADWLEVVA